jgi:hypothetical protein
MNKTLTGIAVAIALLVPGLASAGSELTREEVIMDLIEARESGELAHMKSEDTAMFTPLPNAEESSDLTRAEVVADVAEARDSGELARLHSNVQTAHLSRPVETDTDASNQAE